MGLIHTREHGQEPVADPLITETLEVAATLSDDDLDDVLDYARQLGEAAGGRDADAA